MAKLVYTVVFGWWLEPWVQHKGNDRLIEEIEAQLEFLVTEDSANVKGWWPIQAFFWLEWGSGTRGTNLPAAASLRLAIHSDSLSTRPSQPVA